MSTSTEGSKGLVLVADDEESVRKVTTRILNRFGYETITAEDGVEALALFEARIDEIDLVILDCFMPRMGGEEAFRRLKAKKPEVRVVIATGFPDDVVHLTSSGLAAVLFKPYQVGDLKSLVEQVLGQTPSA